MSATTLPPLGWLGIVRLGLVQTGLGSMVVLTTSVLNRVMVVELALAATIPGLLVGLHYALQMLRPAMGHGSDMGGRRTPWIVGGMAVLGSGAVLAAVATALMASNLTLGIALSVVAFLLIGLGVGAAGTSLLVLLAARVAENRRPAAASLVWIMMIAGFVVTTAGAGQLLDPYSPQRLVAVSALVCGIAFVLALVAVAGIEGPSPARAEAREKVAFREALAQVWSEPESRRFTVFVFVSMLAYSAQDLILEPFAGIVFGLSLGGSTKLAAMQHMGVLLGMILVAVLGSLKGGASLAALRATMVGGCLLAAAVLFGIAAGAFAPETWPLRWSYLALGLGDGVFAAAAIATMMQLAGRGRAGRAGMRMGLWGASQAIAFGVGGLAGAAAVDLARLLLGSHTAAYAAVFSLDALLFLASGLLALGIGRATSGPKASLPPLHSTHGQGGLRA